MIIAKSTYGSYRHYTKGACQLMVEPVQVMRTRSDSEIEGVEIVRFIADDVDLICPYFHQRFLTLDGKYLICTGHFRDGTAAVRVELETGDATRLTEGGAAVHVADLDAEEGLLYFTRDGMLRGVDIESGEESDYCALPDEEGYACSGSVHLNSSGSLIALGGNREHRSGMKEGRIWTISVGEWRAERIIDRPFRIGHVQFSTADPGLILYCHETGGASPRRMWLARTDGEHPGALFDDPGHPWVTHETFTGDGKLVVFVRHPDGIGVIRPDNTGFEAFEEPYAWHPGPSFDGSNIAFDTHSGDVKVLIRESGRVERIGESEMAEGGPHPHPRFAPDDATVVWTGSAIERPHPAIARLDGVIG